MKKALSIVLVLMLVLVGLTACKTTTPEQGDTTTTDLSGTYDIVVWVSEIDGVKDLTIAQIDAFEEANPGIVINATVEGVSEGESATQMITSVNFAEIISAYTVYAPVMMTVVSSLR